MRSFSVRGGGDFENGLKKSHGHKMILGNFLILQNDYKIKQFMLVSESLWGVAGMTP